MKRKCLAEEYVEQMESFPQMKPDEVSHFCHWIGVNGKGATFNQRRAAFRDGSKAMRDGYNGPWIVLSGAPA